MRNDGDSDVDSNSDDSGDLQRSKLTFLVDNRGAKGTCEQSYALFWQHFRHRSLLWFGVSLCCVTFLHCNTVCACLASFYNLPFYVASCVAAGKGTVQHAAELSVACLFFAIESHRFKHI
jgi:hypothetical protein